MLLRCHQTCERRLLVLFCNIIIFLPGNFYSHFDIFDYLSVFITFYIIYIALSSRCTEWILFKIFLLFLLEFVALLDCNIVSRGSAVTSSSLIRLFVKYLFSESVGETAINYFARTPFYQNFGFFFSVICISFRICKHQKVTSSIVTTFLQPNILQAPGDGLDKS